MPVWSGRTSLRYLALLVCVLALVGCRSFLDGDMTGLDGHSPLRPATPSADSTAVEIFVARMPTDDGMHRDLWQQIDEQSIPSDVRRELSRNGFRAGIVDSIVPIELSSVLCLEEGTSDKKEADEGQADDLSDPVDLAADVAVTRQWRRLRPGIRAEIIASGVMPSLPILLCDEDGLHGETLNRVQAVYSLQATPSPQRQATLELIPELHFGPAKTRYVGGEGPYWRMEIARDRKVFEKMRIPVTLRPGQMLVIGADMASDGSLGDHFHRVDGAKETGRRLVVIRLAQVPDA